MPTPNPAIEFAEWRFPNRATPLGSAGYYAVRFAPALQRDRNAFLSAWYGLVREIADRPHDIGVARLKLDWWRGEIEHLSRGTPRHPLSRALAAGRGVDAAGAAAMRAVVDGAEDEMRMPQPLDAAGFAHACHAGLGRFFTLLSTIDAAQAREHDAAAALGAYCDAVERIRCAAVAPHRVEQVLQPAALGELTATDRVARIERALQRFSAATVVADGLPPFVRNWYALSRAMHEKMRRKRYPVARPPLDRAPLAKLWTAWRCR